MKDEKMNEQPIVSIKDVPELVDIVRETLVSDKVRSILYRNDAMSCISERETRVKFSKEIVRETKKQTNMQIIELVLNFIIMVGIISLLWH